MAKCLMAALALLLVANSALFLPSLACPYCPTPTTTPPPPPPKVLPPTPKVPSPTPKVPPPSPKQPPSAGKCPINALKLDACVDLLGGLVHAVIGQNEKSTCCPVIAGLADLDAALCFCTIIKAKVLNINVLLPIAIELLVDCGKHVPSDYQCPA
ncbi:36.4 kDa proline-rich protein-like [Curcuma longa]|uniref:36.4 kDa proline-rich protein-like n=1 Tax=Curcuma longa TaxID=136217 RepID=UPI003D9EA63D